MEEEKMKIKLPYVKEVKELFVSFFRRDFIEHPITEEPKELKQKRLKYRIISFLYRTIFYEWFAYLILLANNLIQNGKPILGIAVFLLYHVKDVFTLLYRMWDLNVRDELDYLTNDAIFFKGGQVQVTVASNVYEKKSNGIMEKMTPEKISNTLGRYFSNVWQQKTDYWFNIAELISVVFMVIVAITSNTKIPQNIFIPLLLITSIVAIINNVYDHFHHSNYMKAYRELNDEKFVVRNDLLRIVPIIPHDTVFRINRFKKLSDSHYKKKRNLNSKDLLSDLLHQGVHVAATIILCISLLRQVETITLETIAELTAYLTIFNKATSSFSTLLRMFVGSSKIWDMLDTDRPGLEEIIRVYDYKESLKPEAIQELHLNPFEVKYPEILENNKPFSLILDKKLTFIPGDVVNLIGGSGTGKSTFLKVCTSQILLDENPVKPLYYISYENSQSFGSLPLMEELFCIDGIERISVTPEEKSRMEYILKQLLLWNELSQQCDDLWKYLSENKSDILSTGQKQRMIVAKLLFWLDSSINVVCLDECTSGLDANSSEDVENADAIKIMKFILDWCNRDKKRIVIISSHSDMTSLSNINLFFRKENGKTVIKI